MIQFDKPEKLNGAQLAEELSAAKIKMNTETSPLIDGNGDFWLDINAKDAEKAKEIVDAHIGKDRLNETQIKKAALLERLGITAEEAKLLLG